MLYRLQCSNKSYKGLSDPHTAYFALLLNYLFIYNFYKYKAAKSKYKCTLTHLMFLIYRRLLTLALALGHQRGWNGEDQNITIIMVYKTNLLKPLQQAMYKCNSVFVSSFLSLFLALSSLLSGVWPLSGSSIWVILHVFNDCGLAFYRRDTMYCLVYFLLRYL